MAWLNWLLKLHIWLRTSSLLISTHITHVNVQWIPYSFVWLYLIKCVFTCSILGDQTQRFLSVLVVFGKSFVFAKMSKISKIVLPYFGNSVAGWSNRMSQSQEHIEIFCGSLVSQCPSCEKRLEYFSKFGFLMLLATQFGDLFAGGRSSREGTQKFLRLTSRLPYE